MIGQRFTYRNPKILSHANRQACTNCGRPDGTVVAAHRNLQEHGRGSHHKAHDLFVAFLCFQCHSWLDFGIEVQDPTNRFEPTRAGKREMFLTAMFKTMVILLRDGVIG